jgi:hypothetical protein
MFKWPSSIETLSIAGGSAPEITLKMQGATTGRIAPQWKSSYSLMYNSDYVRSSACQSRSLQDESHSGHRYRQIVVVELEQFQVRVFGGDVIQSDPNFSADSQDAEVYFHPSLKSAVDDAEKEFLASVKAGWVPYDPYNP